MLFAFLNPGDTVLAMDLSHGGHLTHGAPVFPHGQGLQLRALQERAAGGRRHRLRRTDGDRESDPAQDRTVRLFFDPRDYDYGAFKKVADEVGALTMADISHIGGLVAVNVMRNPFGSGFDVVTTTTHKTLRGPRGGLILVKAGPAKKIDS